MLDRLSLSCNCQGHNLGYSRSQSHCTQNTSASCGVRIRSGCKETSLILQLQHLSITSPTMLQPRIYGSSRAIEPSMNNLASVLNSLTLCSKHTHQRSQFSTTFIRYASHQAQGRANGPKDSAGRRLGAKKSASEYVIPGNIIFKQRGNTTTTTSPPTPSFTYKNIICKHETDNHIKQERNGFQAKTSAWEKITQSTRLSPAT